MPASNMGGADGAVYDPATDDGEGVAVLCDLISGPSGSPLDNDQAGNFSTGGICTGIGYGLNMSPLESDYFSSAHVPGKTQSRNFSVVIPGYTGPDGVPDPDSKLMYIGGGRSDLEAGDGADGNGHPASELQVSRPNPYIGARLAVFGNDKDRDGGTAGRGYEGAIETADAPVADGASIDAPYNNYSQATLPTGQSILGGSTVQSSAIA